MKQPTTAIDVQDQANWNKPLWFVYGSEFYPQMLCAKLSDTAGGLAIWGYSVWQRQPGFRTIGMNFSTWNVYSMCFVFDQQQDALDFLKTITTPKVKS